MDTNESKNQTAEAPEGPTDGAATSRLDRRQALARLGAATAATGATFAAPFVIDSFTNIAAAAGTPLTCNTGTVDLPKNTVVYFDVGGGGGAAGDDAVMDTEPTGAPVRW